MGGMDEAAFHAEQLSLQKDIESALKHAESLGLSKDEVSLLAWASGIQMRNDHGQSRDISTAQATV